MRKYLYAIVLLITSTTLSHLAHAEFLGLPNGRSANLTKMADLSIEGGFVTGDLEGADYDHFGARVNYRVTPGLILFGDVGKSDIGNIVGVDIDATSLGFGVFYQLQDLITNIDATAKAGYHTAEFGGSRIVGDLELNVLAAELLLSGIEPLSSNGLGWYANVGIHRFSGDFDSDTELGIGGGLTLPVGPGEAYFGLDHVDETTFGFGFRYNVN